MPRFRDPRRKTRLDDNFADIPYKDFAPRVLDAREQALVPFLGAGASRTWTPADEDPPPPVDQQVVQELAGRLDVQTEDARLFLEIAVAVIRRLNAAPQPAAGQQSAFDIVRDSTGAPSAAELAQALAERSSYDYFGHAKRRVSDLTGRRDWDDEKLTRLLVALARLTALGSPSPPLLDASSYFADRKKRQDFWSDLHTLFRNKSEATATHAFVATAAERYLAKNADDVTAEDYLVITTNYDCLLEKTLDARPVPVPYYVMTVPFAEPARIDLRFSASARDYLKMSDAQYTRMVRNALTDGAVPRVPSLFSGLKSRSRPLVVIYKIHGSLHEDATPDKDGVVITNEDYVRFLSNASFVPAYIPTRLAGLGLLLLGYSFSDWNIRSLYRSVTHYRNAQEPDATMDYAVLMNPSPYETGFFDRNKIDIFDTPLDLFCQRMLDPV